MLRIVSTLLFSLLLAASGGGGATELVRVGAYPFLPFVDKSSGLTFDLLAAMNDFQTDYRFELVETSANRRYDDMARNTFSVMLFENRRWGWDGAGVAVESSKVFLRGDGEVYVARSMPGRGQDYFSTLNDKQILGVLGYHYSFADFEADQTLLRKRFKIVFGADNAVSLRNLLAGRGDVAVITKSYLSLYLLKYPQDRDKLLVSERLDQAYAHTVLVKKGSKPSAQEIDALLTRMESAGVLKKLWAKYGIENRP